MKAIKRTSELHDVQYLTDYTFTSQNWNCEWSDDKGRALDVGEFLSDESVDSIRDLINEYYACTSKVEVVEIDE